jgi:hypothetical protein
MKHLVHSRTFVAVVVTILVCGATTAGAAKLITGADIKDGSLTGDDFDGAVRPATRITDALPTNGFRATNDTVKNKKDGVTFGPYADGGAEGGSICTNKLNGQPLNDVTHLAYIARYTATGDTGGVGVPYLRIFLENDTHDAIFSPNTQPPDPDIGEGPFHTWVATAGLWRYDDDAGSGGQYGVNGAPFGTVKQDHGDEVISDICITTGFTAGADLSALLRSWELNARDYAFGL